METYPIISGFTDEVSDDLELQIKALRELGWNHIDLRTVDGKNVSSLSDEEFDRVYTRLSENGITIGCFGSTVANWGRDPEADFNRDMEEMKASIRHMKRSGVTFIRIMSYRIDGPVPLGNELEVRIIDNIRQLVRLAEDNGIVCLHENCETWGGQSVDHWHHLLEQVDSPALKLVFDTGNPVSMKNVVGEEPYSYQDSLQFLEQVIDHVAYVHIKDARWVDDELHYTFPGEGEGKVQETLRVLVSRRLKVPIAIEPHVSVVFHDPSIKASFDDRWKNFIRYGNAFVAMASEAGIKFSP